MNTCKPCPRTICRGKLTTDSVIQRAGVVPLSIAGIFKEVSTISISAWVFGDQLTTFNIIGVVITITGKYTLYLSTGPPTNKA